MALFSSNERTRNPKAATSGPDFDQQGSDLCTECGICCAGAIFGHAVMRDSDDVEGLKAAGMAVYENSEGRPEYRLPCPKLDGACCTIYQIRPTVCRKFQCQLLVSVKNGRVPLDLALTKVEEAKALVECVKSLLRIHGDSDEEAPVIQRYLDLLEQNKEHSDRLEYQDRFGLLIEAANTWHAFRTRWFWDDDCEVVEED